MILIDGNRGEGGGQVLRTSLGLSLVTGKPFYIKNIRGGRAKPGLLRQHLTAVKAAKEIGCAHTEGDSMHSGELEFRPGKINPGDYHFRVGTAGSTFLVLQTVLPALMFASSPSVLVLEGGTHNPQSPPFDFIVSSFLPCLQKMGVRTVCRLERYGFYPVGGGVVRFEIQPVKRLTPLKLPERGNPEGVEVKGMVSELAPDIAAGEVAVILSGMGWDESVGSTQKVESPGPGNAVFAKMKYRNICTLFTGFGRKGLPLRRVAESVVEQARRYLDTEAPVEEYLADQLLVPMALAGEGCFRTSCLSLHTRTNIEVIKKFLDVEIDCRKRESWEIDLKGEAHEVG